MVDFIDHVRAELSLEEGETNYLYDDAYEAKPFLKGMTLEGNLTVAVGVNLSDGLDAEEVEWLSAHRAEKVVSGLQSYEWYASQDPVRQVALADIAFNVGITGLLHWPNFLHYMATKNYPRAVKEITSNHLWVSQVKFDRVNRIVNMITTGVWPYDVRV